MGLLAFDLGGSKLATVFFNSDGQILFKEIAEVKKTKGGDVGTLICNNITSLMEVLSLRGDKIESIGICVPGIYHEKTGTVWAPNIPGWYEYPLMREILKVAGEIPVKIDSDRACCILGEVWKGNAQKSNDAIFFAVGTGIGAGILVNGQVLRGTHDIAGALGWMALHPPFLEQYADCGFFEEFASGEGIAKLAGKYILGKKNYSGNLRDISVEEITSRDVFSAYEAGDKIAEKVIDKCIELWGMATANLVSLFNPEKIIFGGGIFGPAISLIPKIKEEATKWAQPISMKEVSFEASGLGSDAGVFGAGFLALNNLNHY
ncbi:MAG: ROK family protein [Ginsengibacter sp.]